MRRSFALSLAALGSLAFCQGGAPIPGFKMAAPPTIDGTVDEAAEWKDVPKMSGLYDQDTGATAPEQGEFWLAYDAQFVYFAARLADSQPSQIAATEYRTNVALFGDDFVALTLDPAGSLSDFSFFEMNSKGATNVNIAGGTAAKREWSGEFISKGRVTATGWEVEARIPWQILRLPPAGVRDVRFNVFRNMPRNNKMYIHRPTVGGRDDNAGRWTAVEIPTQEKVRTLKLLPYAYVGDAEDEPFIVNSGLDMKTQINDQVQLVGTINPDFRNVENQILSLDFSRFERLAGESRPFFQEGSSYIGNALYASQRIRELDAGLNIFGKLSDRLSFGVIDTARFADEEENALVGSTTYQVDPNTSLRASFTSLRRDVGDIENDGYLLRYSKNFGPINIFLRNMGTDDKQVGRGNENNVGLSYFLNGLNVYANYQMVAPDFRPRLGFFPEVDYKGFSGGANFFKSFDKGPLMDYSVFVDAGDFDRYHGGEYRNEISEGFSVGLRNGLAFEASRFDGEFLGVKDHLNSVEVAYPRSNAYRNASIDYEWGEFENQTFRNLSAGLTWRFWNKLQASLNYGKLEHFEDHDQTILSWNYDLGGDRYLAGRAVQSDGDFNTYFSYRRSGAQGMEYYLILGDPNARKWRNSLILKVAYPLEVILGGGRKKGP